MATFHTMHEYPSRAKTLYLPQVRRHRQVVFSHRHTSKRNARRLEKAEGAEVAERGEGREALRGLCGAIEDVAVHWSVLSNEAEQTQPRVSCCVRP
jgi:hypothetical protein